MEYNWTGLNIKLLAGGILLFWIGKILVSSKESRRSSCTLLKRQPVVFTGANCRPTRCGWSELCSYWLTQNGRSGIGCSWNGTPLIRKACREFSNKINWITADIGVILAFTEKKMFYFNQKSEVPLKNSKTNRGP